MSDDELTEFYNKVRAGEEERQKEETSNDRGDRPTSTASLRVNEDEELSSNDF